ncbi:hypothetical protein U1Q18_013180 [Sarracenia purpurea var. burkii]
MERKGNWFSSVKKAFSPESKEAKRQKSKKSKNKWFGKEKSSDVPDSSPSESVQVPPPLPLPPPPPLPPLPPPEEVKLTEVENEETKQPYSAAIGTSTAADTAVAADESAAEVVQLTGVTQFSGKSEEEVAAIKIQTAFRGYYARRASRGLRGFVRLKSLVQALPVKRQTANALRYMQALTRAQSQIQSRRIRILEENQALQGQLLQKNPKEYESLLIEGEWDDSLQSKEQIEAKLLGKFEAAMRREKALAYSFSHQKT